MPSLRRGVLAPIWQDSNQPEGTLKELLWIELLLASLSCLLTSDSSLFSSNS